MTTRILIGNLGLATILMALPASAAAQASYVEIQPGLYDYTTQVSMAGQLLTDEAYEYCLTPDKTRKSIDELVAELIEGGDCQVSNIRVTDSTGSADMSCRVEEMGGMMVTGNVDASYGADHYRVKSLGQIQGMGMPLTAIVTARRRSACPPGWTPPEGISAD